MAIITLNFPHNINVSVQVGDVGYYVPTFPVGTPTASTLNPAWTYGPTHAATTTPHYTNSRENVVSMGIIKAVTLTSITCDMPNALAAQYGTPTTADFIMFIKDNKSILSIGGGLGGLELILSSYFKQANFSIIERNYISKKLFMDGIIITQKLTTF